MQFPFRPRSLSRFGERTGILNCRAATGQGDTQRIEVGQQLTHSLHDTGVDRCERCTTVRP